jgi:hypothetical protein
MCDTDAEGIPAFSRGIARDGGRGGVYERYVLLRSYLALQPGPLKARKLLDSADRIRMPAAIEPVVGMTYDADEPDGISDAWREALAGSREAMERSDADDARKAKAVMVPCPADGLSEVLDPRTLDNTSRRLYDDDDPAVHETVRAATRLGDPTIRVVCAGTMEHGLPLAPDVPASATVAQVRGALEFSVPISSRALFYALESQAPPPEWRQNANLRYCRRLIFTEGQTQLAGYRLRITRKEGLMLEKEGGLNDT